MAIRRMQELWDVQKVELENLTAAAVAGTPLWYAERVKEWQYGYSLTVTDGKAGYAIDDEDSKLAVYVAVTDGATFSQKATLEIQAGLKYIVASEGYFGLTSNDWE